MQWSVKRWFSLTFPPQHPCFRGWPASANKGFPWWVDLVKRSSLSMHPSTTDLMCPSLPATEADPSASLTSAAGTTSIVTVHVVVRHEVNLFPGVCLAPLLAEEVTFWQRPHVCLCVPRNDNERPFVFWKDVQRVMLCKEWSSFDPHCETKMYVVTHCAVSHHRQHVKPQAACFLWQTIQMSSFSA